MGLVLLDIQKACDTLWLNGLLFKLIALHLSDYLLFFLESYLDGCTFTVHLNDSTSTPKPTPSSLLQGAVLLTTSFSLYPSDIARPLHTHLGLYTDNNSHLSWSWHPDTISGRLSHDVATFHTSLHGNSN